VEQTQSFSELFYSRHVRRGDLYGDEYVFDSGIEVRKYTAKMRDDGKASEVTCDNDINNNAMNRA